MDWNIIVNFIKPELFLLIPVLWCIGLYLKLIPAFKTEWTIPLIMLGIGIALTILYTAIILHMGMNSITVLSGIIQGTLIASVTVFGNEVIKQIADKRLDDKRVSIRKVKPNKKE